MSQLVLSLYYGLELQKALYPDLDVESTRRRRRPSFRPAAPSELGDIHLADSEPDRRAT